MKLGEYLKVNTDEVEVSDSVVDIDCPYYAYDGEFYYGENPADADLEIMERWFRDLEIVEAGKGWAFVDLYTPLFETWENKRKWLINHWYNFDPDEPERNWDEECADYVVDLYRAISLGYLVGLKKEV